MATESAPRLRIGVVGTGALGRHHVRLLAGLPEADLRGVYDARPETATAVAAEHGTRAFRDVGLLAAEVEAVVLAVPTVEHARLGGELLAAGCHVLVEKPLASSLAEADALVAAAGERVLAVGHVEFFNPAVQALVELGVPPGFVEVERLAAFSPRSLDIDVVLDLMIHDLQILHALEPSPLIEVRATGVRVLSEQVDIANARLVFASGCVANVTASRVSAEKVRKLRSFAGRSYYSLDYLAQEIKSFRLVDDGGARRIERTEVPVTRAEPLQRELEAFVGACRGGGQRVVSGAEGRQALATALQVRAEIDGGRSLGVEGR
ncbi:MAG: Gfo/Idh/MocA family oxidoreductase [Thermoanaerobaculia bacterium]